MAKFTSNKTINSEWRWNRFFGPAGSSFTIADAMYDEFIVDWAKQIADGDIVITETPTTGNIQMASLTVGDIVLTGTATGNFPGTGGGTTVVGTSPISVSTNSNTATVSIDQTLITAGAATTAEGTRTYVKNATASAMTKGQAVYINGATGTNVTIELATATSELGSSKVLGLLAQDLAVNAFGWVVESGFLGTIDTSTATAGQSVWLGDTPGSRVYGSPPAEPSNGVYLGVVARANSVNGEILVKVQNGYEIDELHDVSAASPSDGHIIQYKTSSGLWTGTSVANAGIAASSHTHAYQPAGTYVTAVSGTAPIAASTTTAGVVSVSLSASYSSSTHDHAGTYQPAGTYLTSISGTTPIVTTTSSLGVVAASHDTTDGYRHVPATSTTNSGKFLKAGATAGSEAWANIAMSDVTTGNYVATVAGGTGVTVTGADANGATKTVAIGQAVATNSNVTFANIISTGYISAAAITASYDRAGLSDTTTITTAGTYQALTSAEVSFTPSYVGQRFLITLTGYASLNTTTIQHCFVRGDITDSSNVQVTILGYSRADNFGTTGRGMAVALTKVWAADSTSARKFKLYGTVQTTNGLILTLAYTQMSVVSIP